MEGCQLKIYSKSYKIGKGKGTVACQRWDFNIKIMCLFKFDHVYNCYFASNLKNIVSYDLVQTLNVSHDVM